MHLIKSFVFGLLGALGALVLELIISNLYFIVSGQEINLAYFEKMTFFLFAVVLIEEIFKYLMLSKLNHQKPAGFATILFFGLGFSIIEIFSALLSNSLGQDMPYLFPFLVGIFLLHTATSGVIGNFIFSGKNTTPLSIAKIILIASGLHLAYNLAIIYN